MSASVLSPVIYYVCSKRCGEIRMTPEASNFQLICEFCTNVFEELQAFIMHIKLQKCLYRSRYMRDAQTTKCQANKGQKLDVVEPQQQTLQIKKPQQEEVAKYITVQQLLEEDDENSHELVQEEQEDNKDNIKELTKQFESEQVTGDIDPLEFQLVSIKEEPQQENIELGNENKAAVNVQIEPLAKQTVENKYPMLNTKEKLLTFIEIIKKHSILWGPTDANYLYARRKTKALKEVAAIMNDKFKTNLIEENVEKQVKSLHSFWLKVKNGKCQKPWFNNLLTFFESVTTTAEDNLMPSRAQFSHLLELLRKFEVLWNCKHSQYMNKFEQNLAYIEIAKSMNHTFKDSNFTKESVKRRLSRLHTRYRKMKTGKIPRFWYYENMKFLDFADEKEMREIENVDWHMEFSQNHIFNAVDKLLAQTNETVFNNVMSLANNQENMDCDEMSNCSDLEGFPEGIAKAINENYTDNDFNKETFEDDLSCSEKSDTPKENKDNAIYTDEVTLALIELYRSRSALWDRKHVDYYKPNLRNEHLEQITCALSKRFELDFTFIDIRKRIDTLRSSYRQNSRKSKFYNKLTFLPQTRFFYECKYCEKTFNERLKLHLHEYTHTRKKSFACDQCDKCYKRPDQLRWHQLQHLEKHQYPHLCDICGDSFNELPKYKIHTYKMHNVPWPHVCNECQRGFATRAQLVNHTRIHTGETPFLCQECGKSFSAWSAFLEHRVRHSKRKTHVCEICNKAFYKSQYLKLHMKTHSNIKDHVCSICDKRFTLRDNLKVHMQIHSTERKYSCRLCGKRFKQRSACSNHMRKQHRIIK